MAHSTVVHAAFLAYGDGSKNGILNSTTKILNLEEYVMTPRNSPKGPMHCLPSIHANNTGMSDAYGTVKLALDSTPPWGGGAMIDWAP